MPGRSETTRATLAGVLAILLWSSLATLTAATEDLPPLELLGLSFLAGGLIELAWQCRPGAPRLELRQLPPAAWALTIGALFGYHALYFIALKRAPAVEANLLNYLWPLLIVVFASLLPGVSVRAGQVAGTLLGLFGAALIVTRGGGLTIATEHLPGYLAAIGAAVTWAGYSVLNRRFGDVPSSMISIACLVVGALGLAAHALFEVWVTPSAAEGAVLAVMGLGPVGAAFRLWDRGTKKGDLALLGTLSYAAPLASTGLLLVFGRAAPHWTQAVACLCLVAGAWLGVRASRPRPETSTVTRG